MLFARNHLAALTRDATAQQLLFGTLTVIVALWYVTASLERGWVPHDEGQLGHTAERILAGDLPHRDYVEPYTGGLSYLHAVAFRLFGIGSHALRWSLLPAFLAFVVCTFWIANRAAPPWLAALVTLLCASLTLPVYPASMPSWYNLFAAVCGTAALLRYLDTGRARWAGLAGLLAGLSIVVKITGLYFVAAALLFLVYRQQQLGQPAGDTSGNDDAGEPVTWRMGSVCCSIIVSLFLVAFAALGGIFLRAESRLMDLVHFALPLAGLAVVLLHSEWRSRQAATAARIQQLVTSLGPFLLGVATPLAVLVAIYWRADAVADLLQGVFVLPGRRLAGAQMGLPSLNWLVMAAPWTGLLLIGLGRREPLNPRWWAVLAAGLLILFALSHTDRGHLAIFQGLRNQLPLLTLVVLWMLAGRFGLALSSVRRQELLLLAAVAALISLVQFPYSGGFYFFYAAPPAVLLALFAVRSQPHAPRAAHCACLVFVILFLVFRVHRPGPAIAGGPYRPQTSTARLELPRCQLTVHRDQARSYQELVAAIQAHSSDGACIYATPDCPEVYFLAGRRNPTRTTYELFDDPHESTARLLATLEKHRVKVVVLKQFSEFSQQVDPELVAELKRRFPGRQEVSVGPNELGFSVLWRS